MKKAWKTAIGAICLLTAVSSVFGFSACGKPKPSGGRPVPADMREGYKEAYEGFTSELHWIENVNAGKKIYSHVFKPDNFDENKEYPFLIMSHGYNSSGEKGTNALVQNAIAKGMLCVTYDFCGGATMSKSEGKTTEMTVLTEVSDLESVLAEVKGFSYSKDDQIVLFGQSFGGLVTALTAPKHTAEVAGVILQAPAIAYKCPYEKKEDIPEVSDNQYMKVGKAFYEVFMDLDIQAEIGKWNKDIFVYVGTEDSLLPGVKEASAVYGDKRVSFAEDSETVWTEDGVHIVKDAPHSFQTRDFALIMPEINSYLASLGIIAK